MTKRKEVYALNQTNGEVNWFHIGHALERADGSLTVQLNVLPTTTMLKIQALEKLIKIS